MDESPSLMFLPPDTGLAPPTTQLQNPSRWTVPAMTSRADLTETSLLEGTSRAVLIFVWEAVVLAIAMYYFVTASLTVAYANDMVFPATSVARIATEVVFTLFFLTDAVLEWPKHEDALQKALLLIPCLPLDMIVCYTNPEVHVYIIFLRCLKGFRAFTAFDYDLQSLTIVFPSDVNLTYRIIPSVTMVYQMVLLFHLLTMIRVYVVHYASGIMESYVPALYYVTYTLCTVGYGDVPTNTDTEKLFALVLFFIAAVLCGVSFGLITAYLQQGNLDHERRGVLRSTVSLLEFLEVPEAVATSVLSFQNYCVHNTVAATQSDVILSLPPSLQDRMNVFITAKVVSKNPTFLECGQSFCLALAGALASVVYCPADIVYGAHEPSTAVHLVVYGVFETYNRSGRRVGNLLLGEVFGCVEHLLGEPFAITIVALLFCETYCVPCDAFDEILSRYPGARELLLAGSAKTAPVVPPPDDVLPSAPMNPLSIPQSPLSPPDRRPQRKKSNSFERMGGDHSPRTRIGERRDSKQKLQDRRDSTQKLKSLLAEVEELTRSIKKDSMENSV